jgi:hypothetical protein
MGSVKTNDGKNVLTGRETMCVTIQKCTCSDMCPNSRSCLQVSSLANQKAGSSSRSLSRSIEERVRERAMEEDVRVPNAPDRIKIKETNGRAVKM